MNVLRGFLLASLLAGSSAWGQTGYPGAVDIAEPRVQWDFNVFGASPEGPFQLEIYYKIFNDGLTYRKDDGVYVAEYELEIVAYEDGEQVGGTTYEERYSVESFPHTLSVTDYLINQINVPIDAPGDYDLVLRLRDVKSSQVAETKVQCDIPRKPGHWYMTPLEFARVIEPTTRPSQFTKQGWTVVPSVSRSYGAESQLQCPVYAEIYGPAESTGTPLQVRLTAYDELKNRVLDTTVELESQGRVTALVTDLDVEDLKPGHYSLDVKLSPDGSDREGDKYTEWFDISWSISTLLRTDFEAAVEQLRYVTKDDVRDSLLAVPDSLRREAWKAFWQVRDPTPGTPTNEYQEEYYRRVRHANAVFSADHRPGWRTDRGRIYISHGEPDDVEWHPFDADGFPYNAPWQVWRYYAHNLEFVFVDRRGSGDYELQYPYDGEYWRRN